MDNFEALGIHKGFVKGLNELGISQPTEIQKRAIPFLLGNGRDFIGQAQTGTGKTAAFGLPLLSQIDVRDTRVQGLVLCPTRELGQQIAKQFFKFTKYTDRIFTEAVYGGEKIEKQISALQRKTHIVVATPGRLLDLIRRKAVSLDAVRTIVLDEADEMLSMGFKKELDEILQKTNHQRNVWLFSATMPEGIRKIVKKYMSHDAHRVELVRGKVVNEQIKHQYVICEDSQKIQVLLNFLRAQGENRGIIFCNTKASAQKLAKQLLSRNLMVDSIHGDLMQKERDKVMRAFKSGKLTALVATDISARGIDVNNLSYVFHHQLPDQVEYYTHRSGRTARGGRDGQSLALIGAGELAKVRKLENELKISFKRIVD